MNTENIHFGGYTSDVMKSVMRVHSKVVVANPTKVMRARSAPMTKSRYDKT
jgi:hypothetical protein